MSDKKDQVRTMFDSIAWRYDTLNHLMTMNVDVCWRKKAVKMVKKSGAKMVLDVATGTGDMALMLANKISGSEVIGIDISSGMLEVGREKVAQQGLTHRITLQQGDAESLTFSDGSFDAVTAAFGVRNFGDIPKGIAEIYRVLKPGGVVCVLELGVPKNKLFGAMFRLYFHGVLPLIGRTVSKDKSAYTYLPKSVDTFPYREAFLEIMQVAGFEECRYKNLFAGVSQIYFGKKL